MNKQQIIDEAREALLEMLERQTARRAAIAKQPRKPKEIELVLLVQRCRNCFALRDRPCENTKCSIKAKYGSS